MSELHDIESTWRVLLPERFPALRDELDWNALRLPDGSVYKMPSPILTVQQIVDAFDIRRDWQLPTGFVPLIGDFHDLIGLDYMFCHLLCLYSYNTIQGCDSNSRMAVRTDAA